MKLAIHGGKPVRRKLLPYGQQTIDADDVQSVLDTLKSDFITQGPRVEQFEREVAHYAGAKHAVAFCNGTAALHAACYAAGIGSGDEVITTPITFAASANCVLYTGGKPVFADIDEQTYNIDPDSIQRCLTPQTKAIIPVDFTGQPAEMDRIRTLADAHDLVIIHDAAHSLGATYAGHKTGSFADMTMFSFHPVKPITTAEGGIIVTDSDAYAQKLMLFRNHGITKDEAHWADNHGPWYYEMQILGMNYRMNDLQAALGCSQIGKLDHLVERRRQIASEYSAAFADMQGVIPPYQHERAKSGWHLYVLQLQTELLAVDRKHIFEALRAENIGVHVHYIPVYVHPYYQRLGYQRGLCPRAEQWYEKVITLPIFPNMLKADVYDVIEAVRKVVTHYLN